MSGPVGNKTLSNFARNFEILEFNHNSKDFFKFETWPSPMKFSVMRLRIKDKRKAISADESVLFRKNPVLPGPSGASGRSKQKSFSNFSIDELMRISGLNSQQKSKIIEIKSNLESLEFVVDNAHKLIQEHFADLEKKVASSYGEMMKELNLSQNSLNSQLDSFYNKCLQNIDYQRLYWIELEEFINEHQIGSETIRSHLDQLFDDSLETLSLEQLEQFNSELKQRRNEFTEKVLMNKSIEFKPELSSTLTKNTIRRGVPKRIDFIPYSILTPQINRLKQLVFSREAIVASNSFEIDMDMIKSNTTPKYSLHSMDACQRVLISSLYEPNCTNLYMFDVFGNLIKQSNIPHTVLGIYSNSNQILVSFTNKDKELFLSLYNQEMVRIKLTQIFTCPACCFLSDDKTYVIVDTMPFLHVYDKNLSLTSKLGNKFSGNYVVENLNVFGQLLFILERLPGQEANNQISVFNMNSGMVEKIFEVPFAFDGFYILTSNLIFFFVSNDCASSATTSQSKSMNACCFDISKQRVKNKVKFSGMHKNCVHCLTKEGLIITLDKNTVTVY